MNTKSDKIKVISHRLNILKWEEEFLNNLRENVQKDLELFPVDKFWFEEYKKSVISDGIPMHKRIENYNSFYFLDNSNILYDIKSINPNSDFIFLNKEIMDGFSSSVMQRKEFNIKLIGRFFNGKMISRIGKKLYYCCFMNNNVLTEVIFIFGNIDIALINPIINEFLNSDINIFINKYFINGYTSNQKFIVYHRDDFDFLIKKRDNNNITNKIYKKSIEFPKNKEKGKNESEKAHKDFLEKENKKLKEDLNFYKREYEKVKKKYDKLKKDNDELINELNKSNKIISNYPNKQNDNSNLNEIISLKNTLLNKDNEILDLKLQLQNIQDTKKSVNYDDILFVHFISLDQKINCPIKCLKTETFAEVEEKLYKRYEEYRETNNNFLAKGNLVLRFKKICENNIKDGDKVQLIKIE